MSKPLVAWLDARSRHWRGQDLAQGHGAPRGEGEPDEHHGDDGPSETVHALVIGHTGASPQPTGRMTEVDAIRARLAELPTGNDWARP